MSGGSLFGSNASRGTPKNLVEFKAGKMTMKGKMVYPDIRKGQLYVYQSDDSLMHFCWKDRVSGYVEDDLIIFPDDCEFKHVPQCKTGRVYLLRFKSSNKKFFVWLQDLKTDKDEEYCRKINEVLNNPPTPGSQRSGSTNAEEDIHNLLSNMSQQQFMQLFGRVDQVALGNLLETVRGAQSTTASTMTASTSVTTSASRPSTQVASTPASVNDSTKSTNGDSKPASTTSTTATSTPGTSTPSGNTTAGTNNKNQLSSALHEILSRIRAPGSEIPVYQCDVVTELAKSIAYEIYSRMSCNLERVLTPHIPPKDRLARTLRSLQFYRALSMFWSALQSGQAGPVISQFGFGPEAVNAAASGNIEEFVNALESEAKSTTGQPQQEQQTQQQQQQGQQEEKSTKEQQAPPPASSSPDKKDDDDEFMALD